MTRELTINWHITESCNFKCQYCFAHWDKYCKKELLHYSERIKLLLDQFILLPKLIYGAYGYEFKYIRLNLVGGETFLYKDAVLDIIHQARERGFYLSAITNGSVLDDELIRTIAHNFVGLGFSVDSIDDSTNLLIGRKIKNKAMQAINILEQIKILRSINKNISIKINTVVNAINYRENMSQFILAVNPDKWKIFKMLPVITKNLEISDDCFQHFLNNHHEFQNIISSEDNDEMTHSYLMVDPLGRFFQNNTGINSGYLYSCSILDNGIEEAFKQIKFNPEKFLKRYR